MDVTEEVFEKYNTCLPKRITSYQLGQKFYNLTIVGYGFYNNHWGYFFQCDCGNYKHVQTPSMVVKGKFKRCNTCRVKHMNSLRYAKFLSECEATNGERNYDLSLITYADWLTEYVKVVCPVEGLVKVHNSKLRRGKGCGRCNVRAAGVKRKITQQDYIKSCIESHPKGLYDYSETIYRGIEETVTVYCKEGGHYFTQDAWEHKAGACCNKCSTGGYRKERYGRFYVVEWTHPTRKTLLKCGITNTKVLKRISKQQKYTEHTPNILYDSGYLDGKIPLELETKLKQSFKKRYSTY